MNLLIEINSIEMEDLQRGEELMVEVQVRRGERAYIMRPCMYDVSVHSLHRRVAHVKDTYIYIPK
jgi:hypothetical protein